MQPTIDLKTSGDEVTEPLNDNASENSEVDDVNFKVKEIPANPILPKIYTNEVKKPPECPIKDI